MQKLLTIVVPVYKVEQYINKCLDSCVIYRPDGSLDEEKMNQLEVIIVNDGTPDRSAELSREYTVRYPQTFRQIDKENGGHGSAWNVGLKEATGKYLRFLDSDDWLTNLDMLMEKLAETDADLVFTNRVSFFEDTKNTQTYSMSGNVKETLLLIKDFSLNCKGEFWFCTYKTSILQPLYPLFVEHISYDDDALFVAPFIYAQSFIVYDINVYNYLLGRAGQSSNIRVFAKKPDQHITSYLHMLQIWNNHTQTNPDVIAIVRKNIETYSNWLIDEYSNMPLSIMWELRRLKPEYIKLNYSNKSKRLHRFCYWPFLCYCLWESVRQLRVNKRKGIIN